MINGLNRIKKKIPRITTDTLERSTLVGTMLNIGWLKSANIGG